MIKHFKPILASAFAALLLAGSALSQTAAPPAQPQAEQASDRAISDQVMAALAADPVLKGSDIAIETVNGEVHLSGTVGSAADAQKAATIARSVTGVKGVKNSLKTQ